ncbi:purine-cytosine permease family protein [Nocardioides mangrovi]|uniref:Cytosine permease n=1 Tax=Nocardioides mangrovi TaxID=2874580 RepID=A0ABS7UJN2_9ACTN|nr:cytosine permease [Nocardioides mangrovi]MBZ5741234.1 cytosine permease [Nocardioides mangrovi]
MSTVDVPLEPRDYGSKVAAVEPGGVEFIPLEERHGSPVQLLWTWASPNLEFATVFVGVIGTLFFGLSFTQAALAILLGTALGAITHGYLSTMGPRTGLPQMVASRTAFGFWGNALPAVVSSVMAGIGWFAVNSVSGALALASLTDLPDVVCLLIVVGIQVVVAFFGHNFVHVFERFAFPVLAVIFLVAIVVVFTKADPGAPSGGGGFGGFMLLASASFGYAAGWNPYASDYSRYLAPTTGRVQVFACAGLGIFLSCAVLELAGAAAVTAGADPFFGNPTTAFTDLLPSFLGNLTLLAIALGAVCANVLNIYSGAMAFLTLEIRLPSHIRRALVAGVFGVIGFFVGWSGLQDAGSKYENFLLVIAYWVAPWLGVILTDRLLRRGTPSVGAMLTKGYANWAGPIAFVVATVVSVWLFSDQTKYVGPIPSNHPGVGDLTPVVGFLIAAVLYAVLYRPLAAPTPPTPAAVASEA